VIPLDDRAAHCGSTVGTGLNFETLHSGRLPEGASHRDKYWGATVAMDRTPAGTAWPQPRAIVLAKGRAAPTASAAVRILRVEENEPFITPAFVAWLGVSKTGTGCFGLNFPRATAPAKSCRRLQLLI